ncbi:unnamed protein product [Didymodactylos carnosus]|uniref:Phosphatidate cytidylyltransferase, mitochondrial n=1 Tax=Didymodactylos carnosus TaxID=1234261 RepID=A0A813P8J5_9BILA|nr:unnamed protein product [Didymodactylos carnosus]CAF1466744.1 unnamed protein product [Didymodactylos carnosus]CAF3528409.1 unnamed protein product [Didymodactylos carnosus]CAF4259228.1 unnamed protein product [Didymodactylos carnosus]
MSSSLKQILTHFPQFNDNDLINFSFGYGSGVIKQQQDIDKPNSNVQNQIDLILSVKNSYQFHQENLKINYTDYSYLRYFGASTITRFQENSGARIYFNPYVRINNDMIKYGIISRRHLIRDLLDWETLYVAGRLHKPVRLLKFDPNDQDLIYALETNLTSALHVALLLLPEEFTLKELFLKITSLSYQGDFRMIIGENKQKISNIVLGQFQEFIDLYSKLLINDTHIYWNKVRTTETLLKQNISPVAIFKRLLNLPKYVVYGLIESTTMKTRQYQDTEEVIKKLCLSTQRNERIEFAVKNIVKRSSLSQTFKGIITAGFIRSTRYAFAKLTKMLK